MTVVTIVVIGEVVLKRTLLTMMKGNRVPVLKARLQNNSSTDTNTSHSDRNDIRMHIAKYFATLCGCTPNFQERTCIDVYIYIYINKTGDPGRVRSAWFKEWFRACNQVPNTRKGKPISGP